MKVKSLMLAGLLLVAPGLFAEADDAATVEQLLAAVVWEDGETVHQFRKKISATMISEDAMTVGEKQPGTVGASDGFGSRLGDTLTNFLPRLGFAADAVTVADDDKSVGIDFNTLFGLGNAVKINATLSEPKVDTALGEKILESQRETQTQAIEKDFGDTDDVSVSVTYGLQRVASEAKDGGRRFGLGRHPALYSDLILELLVEPYRLASAASGATLDFEEILIDAGVDELDEVNKKTAGELKGLMVVEDSAGSWQEIKRRVISGVIKDRTLEEQLTTFELQELAELVDNQPQLTFTGGYQLRDELVGVDAYSGTLKYEKGSRNVNTVRKKMRTGMSSREAFQEVLASDYLAKDRTSFSLTYRHRSARDVTYAYDQVTVDPESGAENRFPQVAALSSEAADEWCGKLTWSRAVKRQVVEIEGEEIRPRIDLSAEYVWVDDDPQRQKRLIAELVYNIPVRGGLSIPISISYADKAEFLGEPDHLLTSHVGLSYNLDAIKAQSSRGGS